jgi:hypothetical protein
MAQSLLAQVALGLAFLFLQSAHAAPIPLTSSSLFISGKKGLFQSPLGFSIHLGATDWAQVPAPANNAYIEAVYRRNDDSATQAALTVRVDAITKPTDLDKYSAKWMKDYPRFGFEVITSKKVKVGNETGFLLDLVNRESAKQLRQVLFVKNKNAVTLTCRDDIKSFSQTLAACNDIIRTFTW